MMMQKKLKTGKQSLSWLLIVLMLVLNIIGGISLPGLREMESYGASVTVSRKTGNLLDGGNFDFFGKKSRRGLWYWRKKGGGPIFCIEPEKGMNDGVSASLTWQTVSEQGYWTSEQYDLLDGALRFGHAVEGQGSLITESDYIVVQSAIWAILSGEWQDTGYFKEEMEKVYKHLNYASGSQKEAIIRNCRKAVDVLCKDLNSLCGNGNPYIPAFAAKYEQDAPVHAMTQMQDGSYEAAFSLKEGGKNSAIRDFVYDMPEGWDYRYEGDRIIFRYRSGVTEADIRGTARPGSSLSNCRPMGVIGVIVASDPSRQKMIGELRVNTAWECYLRLTCASSVPGGGPGEGGESGGNWYVPEVQRYLHEETFTADYGVELEKRDSETGQLLAGSVFQIWEAFDAAQLTGTRLEPDRIFQWEGYRVFCPPETTDEEGYLYHRDKKNYDYAKTFCGGHPEPIFEEDEEDSEEFELLDDEDDDNGEAQAWEAWQEMVDECEALCDFHAIDDSAVDDMLEDRDRTYEDFICLEYAYWAQEIEPRGGYILHGLHNDDQPVPAVVFSSSQNSGNGRETESPWDDMTAEPYLIEPDHDSAEREYSFLLQGGEKRSGFLTSFAKTVKEKGTPDRFAYCFQVENHRTEGEVHISKRDLELFRYDAADSLGKIQGEAVLSGAVYGLYAAQDILHPDGKTGVVFGANELVAIASTDQDGSASFPCITEPSPTSQTVANREGTWIGHPLLLGKYYIKELARSEGYELSVYGINLEDSNQSATGPDTLAQAGSALAGTWSHRINDWDGSWNEVVIEQDHTVQGVDVYVSGYPAGTRFYQVSHKASHTQDRVVTGSQLKEKRDEDGNIMYQTAQGGEYRLDGNGNRKVRVDEDGNTVYDETNPKTEFLPSVIAKKQMMIGNEDVASPGEAKPWDEPADPAAVTEQVHAWLDQEGYGLIEKSHGGGAPWKDILLAGSTNGEWIQEICAFFQEESFWDAGAVEGFYKEDGNWYARIFYDCLSGRFDAGIRERGTGRIYVKKPMRVKQGSDLYDGHYYICYEPGEYEYRRLGVQVTPMQAIDGIVTFGEDLGTRIEVQYEPHYQVYYEGEQLLDHLGNPIPETEVIYQYETLGQTSMEEILEELEPVSYQASTGVHTIYIPNQTDWDTAAGKQTVVLRAVAPDTVIEHNGKEWYYADYLLQIAGIGVTAAANQTGLEAGSYIKEIILPYPGASQVYQDMGTRTEPVIVLQRVIKQPVMVEKNISLSSYEGVNTYKIHRDPFTVLFGGYGNRLANTLPGFSFKIYAVKELEKSGELETDEQGLYDYESFFETHPKWEQDMALEWDRPGFDKDGDLTTVHASEGGGGIAYYGCSIPLPYGRYVVVEQQPVDEAANRHYKTAPPQEIVIPFAPLVDADGTVHDKEPDYQYHYNPDITAQEQMDRYHIRFRTEEHVLTAHGHEGDYEVYKYGKPEESEQGGIIGKVYYDIYRNPDGTVEEYGVTKTDVRTMKGSLTAIDRKYAAALVPWSLTGTDYKRLSYENTFYSSKLRIEKLDGWTDENIIHDGAYFKIYAAMRDIEGNGSAGVTGTGKILWNPDGTPVYNEKEEIVMYDATGAETGIFRAYTTIRDVVTENGVSQELTGYIETYQPLGAGVYVLVEVEAPKGYLKSKPIAFEVYSDQVTYYENGGQETRIQAKQYQYMVPLSTGKPPARIEVSQIPVRNTPTHIEIHKVEGGEETLSYTVRGDQKQLEARGDVNIVKHESGDYAGYGETSRQFHKFSKTAKEDGTAVYDIYVGGAQLSLYEGIELEPLDDGGYKGVSVISDSRQKTVRIINTNTGTHGAIARTGQTDNGPVLNIWDYVTPDNSSVELFFYDLEQDPVQWDEDEKVLYGLDDRGNRICRLDPNSGMAYVKDSQGRIIAYPLNEAGEKRLVQSIQVQEDENGNSFIYTGIQTVKDENGLPVYYLSGHTILEDQIWETPFDKEPHTIFRLPVGAYILEETGVPFDQGYVQTQAMGIVIESREGPQSAWMENDFTKLEIAKIDITTKEEIPDAQMTLYRAQVVEDQESPEGWKLEIVILEDGTPDIYTQWISGYKYDDNGNQITDEKGNPVRTTEPHWIDHIPIGYYILEETIVPHDAGYVHTESMEIVVLETGAVQNFTMEDDYTRWEIHKRDSYLGTPVLGAELALYEAVLDEKGEPVSDESGPVCGPLVLSWRTQREGSEILRVDTTKKGNWYHQGDGSVYLEYIPIGYYVLVEEKTPIGYATPDPLLIELREKGGSQEVQQTILENMPLTVDISKTDITGQQEIAGAVMALFKQDPDGSLGQLVEWWISKPEPHRITHILQGDYVLVEHLAPAGFLKAGEIYFTVTDTLEVHVVTMKDDMPMGQIKILKLSENGGKELKGAKFSVINRTLGSEAAILETDDAGSAQTGLLDVGWIRENGTWEAYWYEILEIQSPPGYQIDTDPYEFQFEYQGPDIPVISYEFTATNRLIPAKPQGGNQIEEKPDTPRVEETPPEKIPEESIALGSISASYEKKTFSLWERLVGANIPKIPKVGDFSIGSFWWWVSMAVIMGVSAAGLFWLKWKCCWSRRICLSIMIILIVTGIGLGSALSVRAAERVVTMTVEDKETFPGPDTLWYDEKGELYELQSWEMISTVQEEIQNTVSYSILLEEIESEDLIPRTLELGAQEENTGRIGTAQCNATEIKSVEAYWIPDFQFIITFHSYDADYYILGDVKIPFDENKPQLIGHEYALLSLAGLDLERYRIDDIAWNGDAFVDESGILCRQALASGQRLVDDYQITYEGIAVYPPQEQWQCRAVYRLAMAASRENSGAPTLPAPSQEYQPQLQEQSNEPEPVKDWVKIIQSVLVITVSLVLIMLAAITAAGISWWKRNRMQKKRQERIRY